MVYDQISQCNYRTNSYHMLKTPSLHWTNQPNQHTRSKILQLKYNFNPCPWAPPGWKAIVHEQPQSCISWGPRGTDAWYTGLEKDHYHCYQIYIMDTKKYCVCKGVTFLPKFCTIPKIQPWDYTTQIVEELLIAIIKLNKGKTEEPSKKL